MKDSCSDLAPRRDPFSEANHIKLIAAYPDGSAEGELTIAPESLNIYGIVHGGCLAALADTTAGWAAALAQKQTCVTVSYGMNFIRPAKGSNQKIRCRAEPEKLGQTLCVYRVILTGDDNSPVATGNFTFFLTGPLEA